MNSESELIAFSTAVLRRLAASVGMLDDPVVREALDLATTTKSVNEVVREYEDALLREATDTLLGNSSKSEMRRAHRELIRKLGPEAYFEGMREAGVDDPEKSLDERDEDAIDTWREQQTDFTGDFAEWLATIGNSEGSRREMIRRVEMWSQAMMSLGSLARANAQGNPMCEWEMDPKIEEHCPTCESLDGQKHRLDWFTSRNYYPQTPGAGMKCGGYNCGCKLRNTKTGEVILP